MTKKTLRDPNAPKRNMSAYLLYQHGMREQIRAQNPGMTFGQLAKYTSAMYAEMPVAEKEAWQARAEADKARYLHELSSYLPPEGFDAKGDAILSTPMKAPGNKRGKVQRDPNAPKRNMSAYLIFQNTMRDHYKRENPGLTFGQLAQHTSKQYKKLTPEEKAMWSQRADEDKARYDAEIAVYVPPPGYDAHGNLIDSQNSKRPKRTVRDPEAPKRARGSFVFFTFEMRPQIMAEFPDVKFVEMGNILGERWRALPPEQKKKYEDMAAGDKARFHMEMQQYTGKLNQIQAQAQAAASQAQMLHQQQVIASRQTSIPQPYEYSSMGTYPVPSALLPQSYEHNQQNPQVDQAQQQPGQTQQQGEVQQQDQSQQQGQAHQQGQLQLQQQNQLQLQQEEGQHPQQQQQNPEQQPQYQQFYDAPTSYEA